jgi:lipopolysaccharide export system protein LptC
VRIAAIAVGLLLALALAWNAGEQHYRNCVNAAQDRAAYRSYELPEVNAARVNRARAGCSRLPL